MSDKISIVIPVYKCSKTLEPLYQKLKDYYEVIFINDNSPENDWEIIRKSAKENKNVKGINLSRNFGEYFAITAGLENATGDYIVIMDGDLQDEPEEIKKLYEKIKEGYDIVFARRQNRQDKFFKKLCSKAFYALFSYLTDTEQDPEINNFGIYKKEVINSILLMKEKTRFFPDMVQWVGFKKTAVNCKHNKRENGKSSYSFSKSLELAVDVMLAFSDKPLKLTVMLGLFMVIFSFFFASYVIVEKLFLGSLIPLGWASTMVSIWFLAGLTVTILGILSYYISKIFTEVKNRPLYIIQEKIGFKK